MAPTRRDFIKNVGIAVASLVAVQGACGPLEREDHSPRGRLRNCWERLDWLAEKAQDWDQHEKAQEARDGLVADHRAALDELVAAGELEAAVADQVQIAFSEAAYHVWRANCGMTCYEPMPGPDYTPFTSSQLALQADLLTEMAESGAADAETVAQAQAAIERDIAFLTLSDAETQALYEELVTAAGDGYDYPSFGDVELEVTPQAAEAARFLIDLLLRKTE